jgi:hypothetical protein
MTPPDKKEKELREPKAPREPGKSTPKEGSSSKSQGGKDDAAKDKSESSGVDDATHAKVVEERDAAIKRAEDAEQEAKDLRDKPAPDATAGEPGATLTPEGFALGWRPSLPDFHDVPADPTGLRVLEEVDPREDLPPIYNQGSLGSCTANAIASAMEYDAILDDRDFGTPSRLFIYYGEREREGTVGIDAGAYGRDGFKVIKADGCPPEDLWPYDVDKFSVEPSDEAFDAAEEHKIESYVHPGLGPKVTLLERAEAFKRLLSNRQTIAFGFTVFESFESSWGEQGVMPNPEHGEKVLGGHEVLMVGYLADYPDQVLCRNSWGEDWGLSGYFLMPWQFACDPRYCADWRSIYRPLGA